MKLKVLLGHQQILPLIHNFFDNEVHLVEKRVQNLYSNALKNSMVLEILSIISSLNHNRIAVSLVERSADFPPLLDISESHSTFANALFNNFMPKKLLWNFSPTLDFMYLKTLFLWMNLFPDCSAQYLISLNLLLLKCILLTMFYVNPSRQMVQSLWFYLLML